MKSIFTYPQEGKSHTDMLLYSSDMILMEHWFGENYIEVLSRLRRIYTDPKETKVYMDFDDCINSRYKQLNKKEMLDCRGDAGAKKIRKDNKGKFEEFASLYCGSDTISRELLSIVQSYTSTIITASVCARFQTVKIRDQFRNHPIIITQKGTQKTKAIVNDISLGKVIPGKIIIFDDRLSNFPNAELQLLSKLLPETSIEIHKVDYQGSATPNPYIEDSGLWFAGINHI